jgi:hypothetical protein
MRPSFKDPFCRAVPNLSITIRHFFTAVRWWERRRGVGTGRSSSRCRCRPCRRACKVGRGGRPSNNLHRTAPVPSEACTATTTPTASHHPCRDRCALPTHLIELEVV